MVKTNGLAMWVLTAASASTHQARGERSLFGRRINKTDHIRVQAARLNRLEERIEKMSVDGDLMAERMRQHRDMRLKGSAELRAKVGELKLKLVDERERMQKDFEEQLMAVREEMWAQAARDRDALEAELGARYEGERERMLEEARERASEMVEEIKVKMVAEADRDRELYAQRAALAEEGQELAREDRKLLQEEKDELARQLLETMEVEEAIRRKIIVKFKARENTLRKNFEAQLREARNAARGAEAPPQSASTRPRATSTAAPDREASQRAPLKSTNGASPGGSGAVGSTGVKPTSQR